MRPVTRGEIIAAWNELADLPPKKCELLVKTFMEEQPALGIYITAQTEDQDPGPGTPSSIEIALTCWKTLSQAAGRRLKSVAPEQIEAVEGENTKALEDLEESSEHEYMSFMQEQLLHHRQHELLGFAVEVLMSGYEDNPDLAPEEIGVDLILVKTVIECLEKHG